jgi:hypothetical protein
MKKLTLFLAMMLFINLVFSQRNHAFYGNHSRYTTIQPRRDSYRGQEFREVDHRNYAYQNYRGRIFYCRSGLFYDFNYNLIYPPFGYSISYLPYGCWAFRWENLNYYYYEGIYYTEDQNGQYAVIEPPIGAMVPKLPKNCIKVVINNVMYYESYGEVYYKKVKFNRKKMYLVVNKKLL